MYILVFLGGNWQQKYGASSSYANYDQSQQIGKTGSWLKLAYLASSRKGDVFCGSLNGALIEFCGGI